jgi:hypothetical protein
MKAEFINYLKSIGMAKPLIDRAEEIHAFYAKLIPEPLLAIFVSEYVKEDGVRQYENLWLISKSFLMEAKNFASEDILDFQGLSKAGYWELRKNKYDFVKATAQSRLKINVSFDEAGGDIECEFKASAENCDHLRNVFVAHIFPRCMKTKSN